MSQALLETEGVTLRMTDGAVRAIARVAEEANRLLDNIGARWGRAQLLPAQGPGCVGRSRVACCWL